MSHTRKRGSIDYSQRDFRTCFLEGCIIILYHYESHKRLWACLHFAGKFKIIVMCDGNMVNTHHTKKCRLAAKYVVLPGRCIKQRKRSIATDRVDT
jgi:hypothetical protein